MTTGAKVDAELYSRQIYAMGLQAQIALGSASVFVHVFPSCKRLAAEVVKNLALSGVTSIAVSLPPCEGSEFPDGDDLLAKISPPGPEVALADSWASAVSRLNPQVRLRVCDRWNNEGVFVQCGGTLQSAVDADRVCRAARACRFIWADVVGTFSFVFDDFGSSFQVSDADGHTLATRVPVLEVSRAERAVVTVVPPARFVVGDRVAFQGVQGIPEVNAIPSLTVVGKGESSLTIDLDTRRFPGEQVGRSGVVSELPPLPTAIEFASLEQNVSPGPPRLSVVGSNPNQVKATFLMFRCLWQFMESRSGQLPRLDSDEDADAVVAISRTLKSQQAIEPRVLARFNEGALRKMAKGARSGIPPLEAIVGGFAAQEAIKACTGKFMPQRQWLFFDDPGLLAAQDLVSRRTWPEVLGAAKVFVGGAGAIGCELLKGMALMGVGREQSGGCVTVTDVDLVERSNLSRQCLFGRDDVGKPKSDVAAESVRRMCPGAKVVSLTTRIGPELGDEFIRATDVVCTALDNVEARVHLDEACARHARPLLDGGTQGHHGSTQSVIPFLTQRYQRPTDLLGAESAIPVCTTKVKPFKIEHCIHWAREQFIENFHNLPRLVAKRLLSGCTGAGSPAGHAEVPDPGDTLAPPRAFPDCVGWAEHLFGQLFVRDIEELLRSHPPESVTPEGGEFATPTPSMLPSHSTTAEPFWKAPAHAPHTAPFMASDMQHAEFIESAADLQAKAFGVAAEGRGHDDGSGRWIQPIEFDKDNDIHARFVASCANLRADTFGIPRIELAEARRIAGRIIPAMVTTTAIVAGIQLLELTKVLLLLRSTGGAKPEAGHIDLFRDTFVDLGTGAVVATVPQPSPRVEITDRLCLTPWGSIEVDCRQGTGCTTFAGFLGHFRTTWGLRITSILSGDSLLWCSDGGNDAGYSSTTVASILGTAATGGRANLQVTCDRTSDGSMVQEDLPVSVSLS